MENKLVNDPVSPVVIPGLVYSDGSSEPPGVKYSGLTKREYFAAMAMQGYLASYPADTNPIAENVAKRSVGFADALLKELSKP